MNQAVEFAPIAIVGQGCVLPNALSPQALWELVLSGQDAVTTVPSGEWHIDPAKIMAKPGPDHDHSWTDQGGYVRGFDQVFQPQDYPHAQLKGLDPLFLWSLHAAHEALKSSTLATQQQARQTGLIMGNLSYPSLSLARLGEMTSWGENWGIDWRNRFMSGYPAHWVADTLGLKAGAFALDAACASSLYAIKMACDWLQDGRADVMLAGGVNHADDLFLHVGFSALHALSRSGRSRPFSRHADGLIPAHGAGFVVLKRLADAVADHDTILGVIRGIGLSNDGRGSGFLAPSEEGQVRAMQAAYIGSGITPQDISLVECHATGTPVGDAVELRSMARVFAHNTALPIGSLKSNLGHLITASGIAALIKVLAAMAAGIRPPTLHAQQPADAVLNSPFRLLQAAEPWHCQGPRRAAINNFGFGGNNAHLIVEQWIPGPAQPMALRRPQADIAIVGLGVVAAKAHDLAQFTQQVLDPKYKTSPDGTIETLYFDRTTVRFPPNDLTQVLPQQLLMLDASLQMRDLINTLPRERTSVMVGMQCDAEVSRYGTRWRLSEHPATKTLTPSSLQALADEVTPRLTVAGVLGKMPNIVANRLNSQFDLKGPSLTVSAEQLSGDLALAMAARALAYGEIDAALVGAVDLCGEPTQQAAATALNLPQPSGDAAIAMVLKRRVDAERDGNTIYALLPAQLPTLITDASLHHPQVVLNEATEVQDLTARFGYPHSAIGLLQLAHAAVLCHHQVLPAHSGAAMPAMPWLVNHEQPRDIQATTTALGNQQHTTWLRSAQATPLIESTPYFQLYSGATLAELQTAVSANQPTPTPETTPHPWRLAIVAKDAEQFAQRQKIAQQALDAQDPSAPLPSLQSFGQGVYLAQQALGGEMAFVFTGPMGSYHAMGRELLLAFPSLLDYLNSRFSRLKEAVGWVYESTRVKPDVLQSIWGAAFLSQIHARFTQDILGLTPQAVIGFCAGEVNSLLGMGAWQDFEGFYQDMNAQGIFSQALGGPYQAIQKAWQQDRIEWATWRIFATVDTVQAALADEPKAHITLINSHEDLIMAGDAASCERVVAQLGKKRCKQMPFDAAIHCPEMREIAELYRQIHQRETVAIPGMRFYSHAILDHYQPTRDTAAQHLTEQAIGVVNFPALINKAWQDGVRIFVEHGPMSGCSSWIKQILGTRDEPYLAVSMDLDQRHSALIQALDCTAQLWVSGVPLQLSTLQTQVQRYAPLEGQIPEVSHPLHFPAHLPPVKLADWVATAQAAQPAVTTPSTPSPRITPAMPATPTSTSASISASASASASTPVSVMAAAPALPPPDFVPDLSFAPPAELMPIQPTSTLSADYPAGFPADLSQWLLQYQAQVTELHQHHLYAQSQVQQQFLQMRQHSTHQLLQWVNAMPPQAELLPVDTQPVLMPTQPIPPAPLVSPAAVAAPPTPPIQVAPVAPVAPTTPSQAPAALKKPVAQQKTVVAAASPPPVGLALSREQLEIHASGAISTIFGELFQPQDSHHRQCRMPEPPLLLADRVTGIDAVPGSMKLGTVWTETDVTANAWYLNQGYMPAGVMIESGQADLLLISYLGIDLVKKGDRVYRLLGCELTYHGSLPKPGETLCYDIHVDGHAKHGDIRLFFFHYDCRVNGLPRLTVRKGQAGFFTDQDLAESEGVLWTPETQEIVATPRLDPPAVVCTERAFSPAQIQAFAEGRPWDCFGAGFEFSKTHVRTPKIQADPMLFLETITHYEPQGGPWQRGYLRAETRIQADAWFFAGHFKNDPCMPGTLMFEGCLQAMAFYLAAQGHTLKRDGWRFEPVPNQPYQLLCRGQVDPGTQLLTYEVFVEEISDGPIPTLYADLLCTSDGLKAFHARRMGLQLVPDWPLTSRPEWLEGYVEKKPVAVAKGFPCDFKALLASAWGKPSEAFGPMYLPFDGARKVARLPGPPYHFMTRVTSIKNGDIGEFKAGTVIELEYDIPADAWYFEQNGNRTMPFCVLLEAALQPCGWLASFVGSALSVKEDLSFRNLDGKASLLTAELFPNAGTFRSVITITRVSQNAGIIIEAFDVKCFVGEQCVYTLETVFGFFPLAALQNQVGLPTTAPQREVLTAASDFTVDLTTRPARYCGGILRLANPMLLMIDRITGYWPTGGDKGLGRLRAEKDVDPAEWFFKAHFFQDPVQPGSLGLEAMLQVIQFYMLENNLHAGIDQPRFEPIAINRAFGWKYRGQVVPSNKIISTTVDITAVGTDERGVFVLANASLWVDGKRIYEATDMGMRIVSGHPTDRLELLDPQSEPWVQDHKPTFTVPALPMMSMVDRLAAAVPGTVTGLRDVRVERWLTLEQPRLLRTEIQGERVTLKQLTADQAVTVASGRVLTGEYATPPTAWDKITGKAIKGLYESGQLIHGPAFQAVKSLVMGDSGSSSVLDLGRLGAPLGVLNQALLDASLHGIPHADLGLWSEAIAPSKVAYPTLLTRLDVYGPTPTQGTLRCECRFVGFLSKPDFPKFQVQLINKHHQVWLAFELVEACFDKGPIGQAEPLARRAFLRDQCFVSGVSLATISPTETRLSTAAVKAFDWLPGTVATIYGSEDVAVIALKEHWGAKLQRHPATITTTELMDYRSACQLHWEGDTIIIC